MQNDNNLHWNLEAIYSTPDAWEEEFKGLDQQATALGAFKGRLKESAQILRNAFDTSTILMRAIDRLYTYAHHRADEDTRNADNQARSSRILTKAAQISAEIAWFDPELAELPDEKLKSYIKDPLLQDYDRKLIYIERSRPHQRSASEEEILSLLSDPLNTPYQVFNFLENADLTFPAAKDAKGQEHPLSLATFMKVLESDDRVLRKNAFQEIYNQFKGHKNTLAASLEGHVKKQTTLAKIRHFPSAIEASLFSDTIPLSVYNGLIEVMHQGTPLITRWIKLRKKVLGITDYNHYDNFVPIRTGPQSDIPFKEGLDMVVEGVAPLGSEYVNNLKNCMSERWIDALPQTGKKSGAYSGGCFDTVPYILMNYNGRLGEVFTLAHELGHSLHSLYSRRNQPYAKSAYPIFLAEVASTTNEMLLFFHLMKNSKDATRKMYLLNHLFLQFRSTLFRQTMFGEYERDIHAMVEQGQPLTADVLSAHYGKLNQLYYGKEVEHHPLIEMEWARIPHFYYNFYVYKYATSFAAAQYFARKIFDGDETTRLAYLDFLKSGDKMDPIDTLKKAGLDMSKKEPLEVALKVFENALNEFEALI